MPTNIDSSDAVVPNPFELNFWDKYIRPKRNIHPIGIGLLSLLAFIPLIMVFSRLLAYPGMQPQNIFGLDWLHLFGTYLNQSVTLQWVPPDDQWTILYLLLLPLSVLIITIARLTFGLRILGFRAILIAVGFQEIGFLPSILLIISVIATIILVRPVLRQIRLPLYARVSVILCISAMFMIGALFLGSWLRSEIIWNVAFFPVIILAMLAESVARTIDRESIQTGLWRLFWTVVLAIIIALICKLPVIREAALFFPELMITQLVFVVFVSEFFDLRLLQGWQERIGNKKKSKLVAIPATAKIAVVRNRWNSNVLGRLGIPISNKARVKSVQRLVNSLRNLGYSVRVFESDISLFRELRKFIPTDPLTGHPGGMVLNLARGVQGVGKLSHLPAMLEMSGVAYTGPDPVSHTRILDRYMMLTLLRESDIPVPKFKCISSIFSDISDLRFPIAIRPRCESDAKWNIVRTPEDFTATANEVLQTYRQELVVEEFHFSQEIRASLIGNNVVECFPLLQHSMRGSKKICPAPLDETLTKKIEETAKQAYRAIGCRDYARIDIRINEENEPCIIQIHTIGIFARNGSFAQSAKQAGYSFEDLMHRVIQLAWLRYGVTSNISCMDVDENQTLSEVEVA